MNSVHHIVYQIKTDERNGRDLDMRTGLLMNSACCAKVYLPAKRIKSE